MNRKRTCRCRCFLALKMHLALASWALCCRKKVYDAYNDEEVQLTKEDLDVLRRIREGRTPHGNVNPYEVRRASCGDLWEAT